MPIGCVSLVPAIVEDIHRRMIREQGKGPLSFLDLGIGFGFYGAVIRQWFDMGVTPYRSYLLGVEGWTGYESPCWDLYSHVHRMTIQQYLSSDFSKNDRLDVILLLDVIEHFEKEEGAAVVDQIKTRLKPGGRFYLGTPGIWCEQGAAYGNELERHRSLWTQKDFEDMGFSIVASCLSYHAERPGITVVEREFDGKTHDPAGNLMLMGVYVDNG